MAQSANNLTISISADSTKLRADMALAQSNVRAFAKEVKQAADEARKTGDATRLREVSAQYEAMTAQVRGLNRALGEQNKTVAAGKNHWGDLAVGVKEAVAAFAALEGVRRVVDIFRDVTKSLTELRNTAKAAALSPGDVKVFQEVIEDTGESADGARQALVNLTDQIAQARIKSRGFGKDMATGVNVLRGSVGDATDAVKTFRGSAGGEDFGVNVARGGQAAAKSVEELTQKILDNAAKFKDNRAAIQSVLEDLAKLRQRDAAVGTSVGVTLLGKKYALFAEAIDRLGQGKAWDEVKKQLQEQGRLPSDEAIKRVEDYNKAVDDVGDAFEKLKLAIALPLLPNVTAGISKLATLIENFDQLISKYKELKNISGLSAIEENIVGPIRRGLTGALDALRQFGEDIEAPIGAQIKIVADLLQLTVDLITGNFSKAVTDFGVLASDTFTAVGGVVKWFGDQINEAIGFVKSLVDWVASLGSKLSTVPSSLSSAYGSAGGVPLPAPGNAAGGLIRGPGTGTSDSIVARLSDGEYVVRARAVQHWGPQFLAALNAMRNPFGYAGGGMVSGRRVPRFAEGGLVTATASDGTAVHLHIGGGSFALRGDRAIVESLTREARRAGMLSGGRLPGAAFA